MEALILAILAFITFLLALILEAVSSGGQHLPLSPAMLRLTVQATGVVAILVIAYSIASLVIL